MPDHAVFVFSLAFSPITVPASAGDDQTGHPVLYGESLGSKVRKEAFQTEPFQVSALSFLASRTAPMAGASSRQAGQETESLGRRDWPKIGIMGEHDRNVYNLVFARTVAISRARARMAGKTLDGTRLDQYQTVLER